MTDEPAIERPTTPEARARGKATGRATRFGDLGTWLLPRAPLTRAFDEIRNRLFEGIELKGEVHFLDIFAAAWTLLQVNYELTPEEVDEVIRAADRRDLTDAVAECLLGPEDPVRSYSDWVRSGLIANAIDPAKVSPEDLPHVLFQLQGTGRMMPAEDYAHALLRKKRIAALLDQQ